MNKISSLVNEVLLPEHLFILRKCVKSFDG